MENNFLCLEIKLLGVNNVNFLCMDNQEKHGQCFKIPFFQVQIHSKLYKMLIGNQENK